MGLKIGVGNTNPTFGYDSYYGVRFNHSSASSYNGTRVGKSTLHQSLPIQSQMRDCLVSDNGQVVAYLDPNDRTKLQSGGDAVLDGSWGQVMCEIPAHYRKFEFTDTTWSVLLSEHALPGFHYVPKCYVGAYKATVDRTNSTKKLCSVKNATASFRGGNGSNSSWDELSKTLLQRPCSNESLNTYRTYAANRGTGWYQHLWDVKKAVWWLFVVEYATLNTQKTFNAALDSNGYHQGGLGNGVTTLNDSKWNSFNGYYPFTPIGTTDSLGNNTGVVDYTMPSEYDSTTTTVHVPAYRGIENPFGEIYEWIDGVCVDVQSVASGGKSLVYTNNDLSKLNFDSNLNGYTLKGTAARSDGWAKAMVMGEQGEIIPSKVGGSSSTYYCDYFYTSVPSSGVSRRAVCVGGSANNGAHAGLVFVSTYSGSSNTFANIGARLCFIP